MSISTQEYFERNRRGLEGDLLLKEKIEQIVKKHHIEYIVETGTYLGSTSKVFGEMVPLVTTIEANIDFHIQAAKYLHEENACDNVHTVHGDVSHCLKDYILPHLNTFYWLDSHWQQHCPLLDELRQIAESGTKPIIAIHDFKVPEHPELGYDSYNGQDLDYGYIQAGLEAIYGANGYKYEYNTKASEGSAARGCIFVYPK